MANQFAIVGTVYFSSFTGTYYWPIADLSYGSATESQVQSIIRTAATAQSVFANVSRSNSSAWSVALRQNGSTTALSIAPPTNSTGVFSDTSDTVSLSSGDLINWLITNGGEICGIAFALVTSGQCSTLIQSGYGSGSEASPGINQNIEGLVEQIAVESAMLSNFQALVKTNSTGASSITTRKNGSNGSQSVSVPSTTTGLFEDTTHTDSLSSGDLWAFQWTAAGGGWWGTVKYTGTVASRFAFFAGAQQSFNENGTTGYLAPLGWLGPQGPESQAQLQMPVGGTWSSLALRLWDNTTTVTATVASRVNGANGNQGVSVGSGTTGTFQDTTDSDSVSLGVKLSLRFSGGSSGNITGSASSLFACSTQYTQSALGQGTPTPSLGAALGHGLNAAGQTTPTPSASQTAARLQDAPGQTTPAPTVVKSAIAVRPGLTTPTPSASKTVAAIRFGLSNALGSVLKSIGPTRFGQTTPTPSASEAVHRAEIAGGQTTPVPSVLKQVAASRLGKTTPTPNLLKLVLAVRLGLSNSLGYAAKVVGALRLGQTTPQPSAARAVSATRLGQSTPTPQVSKAVGAVRSGQTTPTPSLSRQTRPLHLALTDALGFVARGVSALRLGQTTPTPTAASAVSATRLGQSTPAPLMARAISMFRAGQTAPVPAIAKSTALPRSGQTTPLPGARRSVGLPRAGETTPVPSTSRQIAKPLPAQTTAIPTLTRGRQRTLFGLAAALGQVARTLRTRRKRRRMTLVRSRRPTP